MAVEYFFDILSYFTLGTLVLAVVWEVFKRFPQKKADVWITVLISYGASETLKFFINRPRPDFTNVFRGVGTSFPSSHATVAFAVFFFYLLSCHSLAHKKSGGGDLVPNQPDWLSQRVPMLSFTLMLAILTALLRVMAGLHYFSDIFAGIILGFIISWMLAHYDVSFRRMK